MTKRLQRNHQDQYSTRAYAAEIVDAYAQMAAEKIDQGFRPTLLTFTFKELGGSEASRIQRMHADCEWAYGKYLRHVFRRPGTMSITALPMWFGSRDFPVMKRHYDHFRDLAVNDGEHLHLVDLTPPRSRLMTSTADFFDEKQVLFSGGDKPLWRIHAVPIDERLEYVVEYAMKAITRGRSGVGDTLLLPLTHEEMGKRRPAGLRFSRFDDLGFVADQMRKRAPRHRE